MTNLSISLERSLKPSKQKKSRYLTPSRERYNQNVDTIIEANAKKVEDVASSTQMKIAKHTFIVEHVHKEYNAGRDIHRNASTG